MLSGNGKILKHDFTLQEKAAYIFLKFLQTNCMHTDNRLLPPKNTGLPRCNRGLTVCGQCFDDDISCAYHAKLLNHHN